MRVSAVYLENCDATTRKPAGSKARSIDLAVRGHAHRSDSLQRPDQSIRVVASWAPRERSGDSASIPFGTNAPRESQTLASACKSRCAALQVAPPAFLGCTFVARPAASNSESTG